MKGATLEQKHPMKGPYYVLVQIMACSTVFAGATAFVGCSERGPRGLIQKNLRMHMLKITYEQPLLFI